MNENTNSSQPLQIFESPQFGRIRTAGTSEQPLFCLADVCKVLELQTVATKARLNDGGISLINTPTQSGEQQMVFINESNLYKVIMRSNKPQAEAFQDWVCGEVLPSIRKNGAYMNPYVTPENMLKVSKALLSLNEQFETAMNRLNDALQVMDKQSALIIKQGSVISEQKAEIDDRQQMIDAAVEEIQERDVQISKMQPYADYAEQTLMSKSEYTFTEVAKDLGFRSVYQFQDWAKEKGIIFRQGERWLATANWSGRGWFGVRTFNKLGENNKVLTRVSTTITERGRAAMHYFLTHSRRPSEAELNKINGVND